MPEGLDTKKIYEILNSIVTNEVQTEDGVKSELMFVNGEQSISAEDMANLISQMDVDQLGGDEIEMLEILHRRLSNDNSNGNYFVNEEVLVGPLSQKITEYEHLVENKEFENNMTTLEMLKARNQNLSNLNSISISEHDSDSKYKLDYVTVRHGNKVEVLPLSDPDYMERFVNEYANDIASMSEEDLYNKLKNSTNSEMEFVNINDYFMNEETRARLNHPKVDDDAIIGFERDEVQRLVEQFIPGTDIEVGIDKNGEIFYRAGDAVLKGKDKDGHRVVDFVQQPGNIMNYQNNVATDPSNIQSQISEAQSVGVGSASGREGGYGVRENVQLDPERFIELYEAKDMILNGSDPDLLDEFLDQLDAAINVRNEHNLKSGVQERVTDYLNYREDDYREMLAHGSISGGRNMSSREIKIIEKLVNIDKTLKSVDDNDKLNEQSERAEGTDDSTGSDDAEYGTNEESNYDLGDVDAPEVDYFGFEGEEDIQSFDESYEEMEASVGLEEEQTMSYTPPVPGMNRNRVRTLSKNKKYKQAGVSAFVLLLELLTVAMLVMMFLSLDI